MTATPEEIAADHREGADLCIKWLNAALVSMAGTTTGGIIAAARDIIADGAQRVERQAAEIAELRAEIERLRSIIGDTVWCEACGSVVPLDGPPHCDCIEYGNPESQRLRAHDAGAHARVAEQAAEIERLRALTTWRPIAEAPKDGTEMLGMIRPKLIRLIWWFSPSSKTFGWFDESSRRVKPTHWLPLPPPPSTDTKGG